MSYKVGDKVLLQGEVFKIEKDNIPCPYGIRIAKGVEFMFGEEEMISKTYLDGLNEAWELARKICGDGNNKENYDGKTICEIFGGYTFAGLVLDNFTYQEALAKIEAYEESKAIKVGDVVIPCNYSNNPREVWVLDITPNGYYKGIWLDTFKPTDAFNMVKKTGKHLDIEHLLEQIRGNE